MSGELWQMARRGTTLLPSEVKKLAADYDRLRAIIHALREPSEAVSEAGALCGSPLADDIIRAALEAAEREAA